MFGSNDDKKAPVTPSAEKKAAEKKDLFGWFRKKPQQPAGGESTAPTAEPAEPAPAAEAPAPQPTAPAAHGEAADVEPAAEPVAPSRPSRFRINAGSEVLHAPVQAPPVEPPAAPESGAAASGAVASSAAASGAVASSAAASGAAAQAAPSSAAAASAAAAPSAVAPVEQAKPGDNQGGWFARLKQGLSKTSASLGEGMASLFLGKKAIDDDLLDEIETRLLTADVGVEATTAIIQSLTQKVARKQLTDSGALYTALQQELTALLKPVEQPLRIDSSKQPYVILVVGVNGAGKTTTIGKLACRLQQEGKKVMLAAGDTFRAAAVEQLQVWGERNQIAVIAQHTGADSASVIFDAVQAAKARGMDVLIADTAGRLHTKDNLMEELKKVRRVIGKLDDTAPHEVLLVLDAGTGQNAISQAKQFNQTVNLTGLALTKLDGTAKGGVIFALAKQFGLPIRYIGVGEGIDDLRTFEAEPFVQALFQQRERG
ncbi:signal recognition particle-docking protein FtsY [Pseudomonas zhanjiangensis]|uniref:Signal recognition particle receptor FtsY n=1 Tax=Pseudomonas zhanjiangensis TaxID=3239015 RepID=A0ABV3YRK4_9PSED